MSYMTEIICDACSTSIYVNRIATKTHMIAKAREDGWSIGKYTLCEECKTIRKKLIKDGWLR